MICKRSITVRFNCRRGASLPFLAVTLVALMSFMALGIDVGMMIIAKQEVQDAADLAALTAARTLTGDSTNNYNQSTATTNAQNILSYNTILGQMIQPSQLQLTYGSYDYNQNTQSFSANFPPTSGMPTTAVTATVTSNNSATGFGAIFGISFLPNVSATATAVHRPRDIALIMDLSGSMRFGTLLGFDFGTSSRTTNNPDPLYPTFGSYSAASTSIQGPSSNRTSGTDSYTISPSNTTVANSSYSLTYVNGYYQNAAYATPLIRAFDSCTSSDGGNTWSPPGAGTLPQLPPPTYATTPGGDVPLFVGGSTTSYATDVNDIVGSTTTNALWELDGYSAYAAGQPDTSGSGEVPQVWTQVDYSAPTTPPLNGSLPFNGYTQGPGYYGMTFFVWPPDPRNANAFSTSNLQSFLSALGLNPVDVNTLTSGSPTIWSTWQGQGAAGLTKLQNWLQGKALGGASQYPTFPGNYTPTSTTAFVSSVTTWNGTTLTNSNKPLTYYAVCRLFNRAYPGGAAWTSNSFHADWRLQFFGTNNNKVLFNNSGVLNVNNLGSSLNINYTAIVNWISQSLNASGQLVNPFPQQMRAGRIMYYGSIPTQINASNWPNYTSTDQQFWKEFIDYSLGVQQIGSNSYQDVSAMAGYGSDFSWGTKRITAPPAGIQYMSYTDNPLRPLLRYWFGPINMVDYLHNMNMSEQGISGFYLKEPGDGYEAPLYTGKQAFLAAINTMQINNPNDWFSIICYSWPRASASGVGRFNCVRSPLGPNYNYAKAALNFPFSTINADGSPNNTEINPYNPDPATGTVPSADLMDTPRGDGDTCFAMGLMLAYNQFATTSPSDSTLRSFVSSSPITFPTGMAGGLGRKGAQKVIIFETDGMANCMASASKVSAGSYKYYKIRYDMNKPNSSEYPSVNPLDINNSSVLNQIYQLVQQLATDYGTSRNPFRLYAIGFGPVFQGPDAASALQTLQYMQYYAGTQSSPSTPLASNQVITGTDTQMLSNMTNTFTSILQNGVQIALIK